MTQLLRRAAAARLDVQWALRRHLALLRRFFRFLRHRIAASCASLVHPQRYRSIGALSRCSTEPAAVRVSEPRATERTAADSVELKICLLGDCNVGKTTFMERYVGEQRIGLELEGLSFMQKNFAVGGGNTWISFNIWDVAGERGFAHHLPIACKDAGAILFMFDLTRRRTLSNVVYWYRQATKWNKTAIPVMVGTKFDELVQLPLDMQWTIVKEARSYARAMGAALFFSSATHDINVNKIFKFIAARMFNSTWAPQRNLTVGEPIVDF